MKKLINIIPIGLIAFSILSCNSDNTITEIQVITALNSFFSALDVENFDRDNITDLVTDDFRIYEKEMNFTLEEFLDFVDSRPEGMISTDWELSNYTVSIDNNSAHVYYFNQGQFVVTDQDGKEQTMNIEWLESVYMVREDESLKIKFLQSDDI